MINFKNTYKPASELKVADKFRLIGGAVLIVDSISATDDKFVVNYHTFDMKRDGSKFEASVTLKSDAKVREA